MKYRVLLIVGFLFVLLSGCNDNPAWVGKSNSTDKAEIQAAETCKCLYEMLDKEVSIDRDLVVSEIKARMKTDKTKLPSVVLASKDPETSKALAIEEDFSMKMDDCECMKPVHENLLNQGVTFEDMMDKLDIGCLLGAFYN